MSRHTTWTCPGSGTSLPTVGKTTGQQLRQRWQPYTYRQEDVTSIHEDHDETSNTCVVVEVASDHERDRNDMVRHHLPVVRPAGLRIEDEDLMHVERGLEQVVELDGAGQGYMGIMCPHIDRVEDVRGQTRVNVL